MIDVNKEILFTISCGVQLINCLKEILFTISGGGLMA